MRYIDAHTHIFDHRTYAQYQQKTRGHVEQVVTIQYWTDNRPARYPLAELVAFAAEHSSVSVVAAANIHVDPNSQLPVLEQYADDICGVKMYPGYQHFFPTDDVVLPYAEFCAAYGKPLVFHSGDCSARGTPLLKYAHPLLIDELAARYPGLTIVIAHLGFPWMLEAAMVVHKNEQVYADLSGTVDQQDKEALTRLTRRYADELKRVLDFYPDIVRKIMFGTDFSGNHTKLDQIDPYFEIMQGVFDRSEQEWVGRKVAEQVYALADNSE
jgi:predicted TIM-barrel fold metal-dependent hydrolase